MGMDQGLCAGCLSTENLFSFGMSVGWEGGELGLCGGGGGSG